MHFTCCAIALEGATRCKCSSPAQSRPKQGNVVETSAVRPPPRPQPQEPRSLTANTWIDLCTKLLQAKQLGTGTCKAVTRLKGLQPHIPCFLFIIFSAFISPQAFFFLPVFFSKLKVILFLMPQSRSTGITFFFSFFLKNSLPWALPFL